MPIQRAHFAAGDYLTRYPRGHKYELRIDAPFEKPGWKARNFSPAGQSIFPGSAVQFEGKYYEVVFQDYEPGPSVTVSYYLNSWDETFPIRMQFHYTKEECRNIALAYRNRIKSNRQQVALTLLTPFLGMLPAEDQIRIANKFGLIAARMTFISALALLAPAGYLVLFLVMHFFVRVPLPGPASIHWIYPVGLYLVVECFLRMITAGKLEEPIGSMILSLPVMIWRSIRQLFDPDTAQKKFESLEPDNEKGRSLLASAQDQIVPSPEDELVEIISILPKPHWNSRVGIGFNGSWYGLVENEKIKHGKEVRYRFVLKRAPEGTWFAKVLEYSPDEVQVLYRNHRRQELKTWVDTFAFFWGFLSREDQERLEDLYEFDSLKFTRLTIFSIAFLSFANLSVSMINLVSGVGSVIDGWFLLPAAFFLFESYSRWKDWRAGEPSGSVVGVFLRPFARKLLEGS